MRPFTVAPPTSGADARPEARHLWTNHGLWMNRVAASLVAMTGEHALTSSTFVVADDVDPVAVAALRAAGALDARGADPDISVGGRSIPVAPMGAVTIRPTGPGGPTVSAGSLQLANAAMAVLAPAAIPSWPSDTRLAAPPRPVIAVRQGLDDHLGAQRDSLTAAVEVLRSAGAQIVEIGAAGAVPDDADVALAHPSHDVDACSVTVPVGAASVTVQARAFDDAVALDVATLLVEVGAPQCAWPLAVAEHAELVVFGAHLRGGALAHELTDLGARWAGEIATSGRYRMMRLPTTPPKPAVTRVPDGAEGTAMKAHRWLLSPAALGRFLVALPAPMQLGKVEFDDGSWRTSFGCDGAAADAGVDISRYGGWAAAIAAGAVT